MNQLRIVHWNCFKLTNERLFEIENFLSINRPDIFSLQEIKLNLEEVNLCLNFPGYSAYIKTRTSNQEFGCGVAILISSRIPHSSISVPDDSLELVGVRL